MSLIRKHVAVLQAWACLALVLNACQFYLTSKLDQVIVLFCHDSNDNN